MGSIKWDILALTANNSEQKKFIQDELLPQFREYFSESLVIEDYPSGSKIGRSLFTLLFILGSGGATVNAIVELAKHFGTSIYSKRILLMHSGGFSVRLPHSAAIGKLFMNFPGGKCLMELKLDSYLKLLNKLEPKRFALFITASDTYECFDVIEGVQLNPNIDIVLFGHASGIYTALHHGVYILDSNNELETVWQKPNRKKLSHVRQYEMDKDSGKNYFLTDSCFLIQNVDLIKKLASTRENYGIINCEICAYGDFLRGLGKNPENNLENVTNLELLKWRKIIRSIFEGKLTQVINLGKNSFYHFGTTADFLENVLPLEALFRKNILLLPDNWSTNVINSNIAEKNHNNSTFVEYSTIEANVLIEENCLLSRIKYLNVPLIIPKNTLIIGFYLKSFKRNDEYPHVTVIFPIDADFKAVPAQLKWFEHELALSNDHESLWTIPIFPIQDCPYKSFSSSLKILKFGPDCEEFKKCEKISLCDAIQNSELKKFEWKKLL